MNMTPGWLSIALACTFGTLIGTLTALEISTRFEYGSYLWAIGALVGGITAYVTIDFRHFCTGVVHSYRRTIAWKPYLLWWKAFALTFGSFVAISFLLTGAAGAVGYSDGISMAPLYWIMLFLTAMGAGLAFMMTIASDEEDAESEDRRLRSLCEMGWHVLCWVNPIGLTLAVILGLKWVAVRTPSAIARAVPPMVNGVCRMAITLAQFVAGVFVYVHSQRRTICFVDATIGVVIGYVFGSAIIGAIAGALLGVLNYEIVSVRLLRIVPSSR